MKITANTSRLELAAIITAGLSKEDIKAVLVGGAVVSIYTDNEYESKDLDFISPNDHKKITDVMINLGFKRKGKNFFHSATELSVEFPSGPIGIGDRVPVKPEGRIEVKGTTVILLSPTQSVMDRLAWFYFNNDRQCLDQAVMIAKKQLVKLSEVKKWTIEEKMEEKFAIFLERLKQE
ncbi:MAG: hypothetical protein H7235_00575 [Bdellovibrionaceae bacterium]|nr:hypothetical protein [Pseudobdellovibrionaceae bacterium]